VTAELRNYFGTKVCATTIPRNIRLAEAPSHGKPALVYDPRSRGAESYIRLAKEILGKQLAAASSQPSTISHQPSEEAEKPLGAEDMDKTA
jgi:chromosome partitioning protein